MKGTTLNDQELFWKGDFGAGYIQRNSGFDLNVTTKAWKRMLDKSSNIESILECGSNAGRNLQALRQLYPRNELSLVELNPAAFKQAVAAIQPTYAFNGSIQESNFKPMQFDLCFVSGVLIHIAPENLEANLAKIYSYAKDYVLICEYFNRTPETITYHGHNNKLFKRDFGRYFMEHFPVTVLDYGFLWAHEFESGGFDDMTWWLFSKKKSEGK